MPYKDKEAQKEYHRKYSQEHREQSRESDRKSYHKHADKRRAKSRKWNKENKEQHAANERSYYARNKERLAADARRRSTERRLIVLAHYGGKCQCCGEDRYEFLAMDHINGGGTQHKKTEKISRLCGWLFLHNFPDGFRVLCHNCNSSYGYYGYCPHQEVDRREVIGQVGRGRRNNQQATR